MSPRRMERRVQPAVPAVLAVGLPRDALQSELQHAAPAEVYRRPFLIDRFHHAALPVHPAPPAIVQNVNLVSRHRDMLEQSLVDPAMILDAIEKTSHELGRAQDASPPLACVSTSRREGWPFLAARAVLSPPGAGLTGFNHASG